MSRNESGGFRKFINRCVKGMRDWRHGKKHSVSEVPVVAPARKAKPAARVVSVWPDVRLVVTSRAKSKMSRTTVNAAKRVAGSMKGILAEKYRQSNRTRRARKARGAKRSARGARLSLA